MSWLFSQASVAEYSAATSSAGARSAPLSVMPTPHKYWRNDKPMDCSRLSRFGLTCAVLTDDLGEALLTWFREDFLVRTSRSQAPASVSPAPAPDCGGRWHELPRRYDRATSSWRTHHCLWEEDLPWCSVTLPKWGMTRDGVLSEQLTSARLISGTGSGSSQKTHARRWPTPVASMAKGSSPAALTRRSGADRSNDRLDHGIGWWSSEPGMGRVADGVAHRVDRLKAIGNGQVPVVAASAFKAFRTRISEGQIL